MNKPQIILSKMESLFPNFKSELTNWNTPFQFLICIILSAQTTDKKVNSVTLKLFEQYPTSLELSNANISDIEILISGVNYFKNKAKFLIETSKIILEKFNGEVPKTIKELISLKGVGEKTANVFLNDLYRSNEGIGADTHVMRVAQRMGLTKNTTPEKISKDLEKIYPKKDWYKVNSLFVLYGRYYCKARMKKSECVLKEYCSYCKNK
jgi:endonuclease-3